LIINVQILRQDLTTIKIHPSLPRASQKGAWLETVCTQIVWKRAAVRL